MKKVTIILILFLLSCYYQPGIKLLNLKTNKSVMYSNKTGHVDEIVPMTIECRFVFSITREDEHLKLVKRDLSGELVEEHEIPLFSKFYGLTPYALSPDESKIVYFKDKTESIYLYNLSTKSESLLCEKLVSNEFNIKGIFWMNNDTVIILLDDDPDIGRKNGEIIRIDVATKKIEARLEFEDSVGFSFSPTNMLLAVAPMTRGEGIKIIDLKAMTIITAISNSNQNSWMNLPAWNPDGTKLAYVDANNRLSIYDMKNKITTTVRTLPKDNVACFVAYPNENICVIQYGNPDRERQKMYFIDLNSKSDTRIISDVRGTVLFVDNGNVVTYE